MNQTERLKLAARVEVAHNLARMTEERWALHEKRLAPVVKARKQFEAMYGRGADPSEHGDVVLGLVVRNGGAGLRKKDFEDGIRMWEEIEATAHAVVEASDALLDAMGRDRHDGTIGEWVGVTEAEYDAAIEAELERATR